MPGYGVWYGVWYSVWYGVCGAAMGSGYNPQKWEQDEHSILKRYNFLSQKDERFLQRSYVSMPLASVESTVPECVWSVVPVRPLLSF